MSQKDEDESLLEQQQQNQENQEQTRDRAESQFSSLNFNTIHTNNGENLKLEFNNDLYREIRRLESFKIPGTGKDDEDDGSEIPGSATYVSPKISVIISQLLFTLPFFWTIIQPFYGLELPKYVYFDSCKVEMNDTQKTEIDFTSCIQCNTDDWTTNSSNRISTDGVSLLDAFPIANLGFLFFVIYSAMAVNLHYNLLCKRAARNEIMLCYGIYVRPRGFKLKSFVSLAIFAWTALLITEGVYITLLMGATEGEIRKQIQFGQNNNTRVCLSGLYKGLNVYPVFWDDNPSFGGVSSTTISAVSLVGNCAPFFPILLTLINRILAPFKSISSEDVIGKFALYKKVVKCEVHEEDFDQALREYENQVFQYKKKQTFFKKYCCPKIMDFGTAWGTTVEDINNVYNMSLENEKKRNELRTIR